MAVRGEFHHHAPDLQIPQVSIHLSAASGSLDLPGVDGRRQLPGQSIAAGILWRWISGGIAGPGAWPPIWGSPRNMTRLRLATCRHSPRLRLNRALGLHFCQACPPGRSRCLPFGAGALRGIGPVEMRGVDPFVKPTVFRPSHDGQPITASIKVNCQPSALEARRWPQFCRRPFPTGARCHTSRPSMFRSGPVLSDLTLALHEGGGRRAGVLSNHRNPAGLPRRHWQTLLQNPECRPVDLQIMLLGGKLTRMELSDISTPVGGPKDWR
jgi:hypothetical protein